ncbi:Resolvase, Holliday junction-type [Methanocaldococcus infernus ME]|uniref:Crossover junction endodeoxyribonuclease Hjc n=1 Tax=Methanocaldococcus infernus (strain DSM 11812 / JCM 15783 / ME) TaxID=573063 RepID=D5VS97_METIM|nr:Holliday junction resolvase Hjc [Methanocaldococcus infernus]ADG13450.1 Resolvase, Holliday junction-type [Methanocaldococcus infernus ME]
MYKRGYRFEIKLKEMLEREGYLVIRSAGSKGVDLIAGKGSRLMIFECKATKKEMLYIDKEDVFKLLEYSRAFKAVPYIAVKFGKDILFFSPYNIEEKGKSFLVRVEEGLKFEDIVR